MKRPSFQFYPSDWLRDTALRTCSTGARGLWIDMICYMHEGTPYGHMKVGDKVILPENLARMVGETLVVVEGWLKELKEAGVYDLTEEGVICSRRMIRDESIRNARAQGGKLGGNPSLVGKKVNHEVKQKPTPSSSSSSSSSASLVEGAAAPRATKKRLPSDWVLPKAWGDWALKDSSFTEQQVRSEADKFRDHWLAIGEARLDWEATWRNWIRRAQGFAKRDEKQFKNQGDRNADVMKGLTRGLIGGGSNVKLLGN